MEGCVARTEFGCHPDRQVHAEIGRTRFHRCLAPPAECQGEQKTTDAATNLERGTSFATVAAIMGWAASAIPRMVKRYGHISNQAQQDAVNHLGSEPDAAYYKKFTKSEEGEMASVQ